jgi:tetratricopeptide (TPR) repeat protein
MGQIPSADSEPDRATAGEEGGAEAAAQSAVREPASPAETPGAGESTGSAPTKRQRQRQVLDRLRQHFQISERVMAERRFQANLFYKSAMVALHRKSVIEAESSVRLAIAFDPWNTEYKQGFSEVLAQAHQLRAEELLERASLDGASQVEALRLYEEALLYRPCDPEINDKAARLAVELRELEKAREYAESACEVAPDESQYRCTLARVLRSAGLVEKAREAVCEALRLDPQSQEAHRELQQLRRKNRR